MISLQVIQLAKSFGTNNVFSDISFEHQNSTLGIAGSNGSGKSTFLKCLGNLLRPTSGTLKWEKDGQRIPQKNFQQTLGYAAPYINLYNELSCRENLTFLTKIQHNPNAKKAIEKWLRKADLNHVADHPFGKLSTGQQQRLRLASALFHNPDILLLDEPGSNLDEAGRALITEIVEQFHTSHKILVLASNNPAELNLCDRIFSIEKEAFSDVEISE